jgi:hypothetical protein
MAPAEKSCQPLTCEPSDCNHRAAAPRWAAAVHRQSGMSDHQPPPHCLPTDRWPRPSLVMHVCFWLLTISVLSAAAPTTPPVRYSSRVVKTRWVKGKSDTLQIMRISPFDPCWIWWSGFNWSDLLYWRKAGNLLQLYRTKAVETFIALTPQ